jgi:hypothetical protein
MKKASEYRQHAKECRALASQAFSEEHRKQLAAMADTWDNLADERAKLVLGTGNSPGPNVPPPSEHGLVSVVMPD